MIRQWLLAWVLHPVPRTKTSRYVVDGIPTLHVWRQWGTRTWRHRIFRLPPS